jgi:uncharacterized protein (TIGR01777 family)
MKVLLTGATGFVGKQLCKALALQGHELVVLTRSAAAKSSIPAPHTAIECADISDLSNVHDTSFLEGLDAVIHLAGESIVGKRWSATFKEKIHKSRVQGTQSLIELLGRVKGPKPKVFITASAIGYYGDCGDQLIDESHPAGSDFLSQICKDWEGALFDASIPGIRKVALRLGIVLGKGGGALEKMIPAFATGFGATLGNGKQWMSWVHIDDLVSIFLRALTDESISGPLNACSPDPVTNQTFTEVLSETLQSLSVLSIPRPILSAALGELTAALIGSQRIVPERLNSIGFKFHYSKLGEALLSILGDSYAQGYDEFLAQCWVPRPIEEVYAFFATAHNLEVITPQFLNFKILSQSTPEIQAGTLIDYRLTLHGLPLKWRTEITEWNPCSSFVDSQIRGPYRYWRHMHNFTPMKGGTLIEDHVLYRLPMAIFGKLLAGPFVKKDVAHIFAYRTQKIFELLA